MDFYDRNRFSDYIDYRMHRRHRGALVRDILNQVEFNRGPLGLGRQPIQSVGTMCESLERLNGFGADSANPNDVTYRALPDVGEPTFRAMPPYPLTSKRYPFCATMDKLASDIQQNREQYSPEPTRFSTPPPEVARVHGTTLMTGFQDDHCLPDYYFMGRARDSPPCYTKPLDEIVTPLFYTRPQQPFAARLHSPEIEMGPELIAQKRNEDFPFRRYRASFTPYAPYRNVHTPVSKRLNPEWMTYKPYEYRWHQFRYVYEPEPFSTIKDMEMFRITRPREFDLLFKKMDSRKWDKTPAFDALRKDWEEMLKRKRERQNQKVHVDDEPYIHPKRDLTSIRPTTQEPKPRFPRSESSVSAMKSNLSTKHPVTPPPSPELTQKDTKPPSVSEEALIPDPIPEPVAKAEPEGEKIIPEEPIDKKKRKKLIMSTGMETQEVVGKPTPGMNASQIIGEEMPIGQGNDSTLTDSAHAIPNSKSHTTMHQKPELQQPEPEAELAEPEPQQPEPEAELAEPEPETILAEPEPQQPEPEAELAEPEPEAILAEPEPQQSEPEAKLTEPEPQQSEPETKSGEHEPQQPEPEAILAEPEPQQPERKDELEESESTIATCTKPETQVEASNNPLPAIQPESSIGPEQCVTEAIPQLDTPSLILESGPDQEASSSSEKNSKETKSLLNLELGINSGDSGRNSIEPIAKIEQEVQGEENTESQTGKVTPSPQDDSAPHDSLVKHQSLEVSQEKLHVQSEKESNLEFSQTTDPKSTEQTVNPAAESPRSDQAPSTMVEADPKPDLDSVQERNDNSVSIETTESTPSLETMPTGMKSNGKPDEVLIQDEPAVVEPVQATVEVKPTSQTLIEERDLGENESIQTEYEIQEVEITP
ncbi:hypothetical protein TCAL_12033 [Tigriopus californicus]|uniref:Uncharacterized protein n=1 Tax=Tigriopus californicus TaxID=6832 RepID=A0A553PSZ7_TIGCA|nr:titin-like isoform X1 [Tigriopus californicus]TRY80794.1 hypothetical protein TCAL_12033 [Tigriopus californicus]